MTSTPSWVVIVGFYPVALVGVQDRGLSHTLRRKRVVVVLRLYWP